MNVIEPFTLLILTVAFVAVADVNSIVEPLSTSVALKVIFKSEPFFILYVVALATTGASFTPVIVTFKSVLAVLSVLFTSSSPSVNVSPTFNA